ncbi:adenylate cyclase type 10-like [Rhea pennata]|uniref:adenylate cyclase type 10-like n=1 Tax=Rhea pennata TaxID=8795 RepID=UPI002E2699AF
MGNDARALYYLLESAAACLHVSDNYLAFTSLRKAEALRSSAAQKAPVPAFFEEATFLSLQGEVCYNVGRVELAKTTLRKALSLLGRKFPGTSAGAFFQLLLEQSAHASHQKSRGSCPPAEAGTERLPWLFQQSRCLSLLRQLFSLENTSSGRRLSLLAALMRVNAAEESEDASHILASYLEYVQCCQELGRQEERMESGRCTELEKPDLDRELPGTLFTALFLQMSAGIGPGVEEVTTGRGGAGAGFKGRRRLAAAVGGAAVEVLTFRRCSPADIATCLRGRVRAGCEARSLAKGDLFPGPKPEVSHVIFMRILQKVYGICLEHFYMVCVQCPGSRGADNKCWP